MTEAIIFDMDGTLTDSSPTWMAAEDELFAAAGSPHRDDIAQHFAGLRAADVADLVHRKLEPDMTRDECRAFLRDAVIRNFREKESVPIPGAIAMVKHLAGTAPMAVASGSPVEVIEIAMDALGIRDLFALLLSSEEVPRGKPHPDCFLEAAKRLGASPPNCVVFEDSLAGVQAGVAAGMRVFASPSRADHADEIARIADVTVATWDEVTLEQVQ